MFKQKTFIFCIFALLFLTNCASYFANPSATFRESDLIGIWEAQYGKDSLDKIEIRDDGTFKQTYKNEPLNYLFETPWNPWRLEYLSDGSVYLHLPGGRYFPAGEKLGELDGRGGPCPPDSSDCFWGKESRPFFDPYRGESIEMLDELVLILRINSFGELILYHMQVGGDNGFPLLGRDWNIFRRVESGAS